MKSNDLIKPVVQASRHMAQMAAHWDDAYETKMKRMKRWFINVFFMTIAMACGTAFAAPPDTVPSGLTPRIHQEGGVTVKVTPLNLTPGAPSWDFEVMLETHTQALNQDMTKAAVLIDAQGKPHAPLGWDGDPPGGHHRRGVLRFQPLAGNPAAVELRVLGIGGVDVRTFRWQLK